VIKIVKVRILDLWPY